MPRQISVMSKALILFAGILLGVAVQGTAVGKELKLAHFMPPGHILHQKVFLSLAEDLAKATGGELTIKIYPSEALGQVGRGRWDILNY